LGIIALLAFVLLYYFVFLRQKINKISEISKGLFYRLPHCLPVVLLTPIWVGESFCYCFILNIIMISNGFTYNGHDYIAAFVY
jgi:hypothetical protein